MRSSINSGSLWTTKSKGLRVVLHLAPAAYPSQMFHACLRIGSRSRKRVACDNPACGWTGDAYSLRRSSARDKIRVGIYGRVVMSINGWKTPSVFGTYNITNTRDIQDALERIEQYCREQAGSFGDK
jgi:hypothetical protein